MTGGQPQGTLLVVLLNPPAASSGGRTLGAVQRAAAVLGFDSYIVANLFVEPTPTVIELNSREALRAPDSWSRAQAIISEQLVSAGGILAAWGVAGASGALRRAREERAAWLFAEATEHGHESIWMVGSKPRHPSRWHQYVANKHGRTSGGSFEERLAQVLISVPIGSVR